MSEKNALAELAERLDRVGVELCCDELDADSKDAIRKAQHIIAELAKVKVIEGTYGDVAVLSETETDALFQKILTIAIEK